MRYSALPVVAALASTSSAFAFAFPQIDSAINSLTSIVGGGFQSITSDAGGAFSTATSVPLPILICPFPPLLPGELSREPADQQTGHDVPETAPRAPWLLAFIESLSNTVLIPWIGCRRSFFYGYK
jgi:hypothetical protein